MDIVSVQGLPFLACLLMVAILSYIGIHVLKREVIFIDIALAQIAAVGAIAAHVIFHMHGHSIRAHALSLGATLVAAAFFAIVRRRVSDIPLEGVIGVSYAVSAAGALFLVGVSPGGHIHVQEMLAGSILWASWRDLSWSAGIFAAVGLCFYLFRKPFHTISEGYEDAVKRGYNTLAWDFLFYALLGVVITTAVRIAGVVVVFTFLIIPATLSAVFASGWAARIICAWAAGAVSAALGLMFADRYDFSVGPAIALFLGSALVAVGLLRLLKAGRVLAGAAGLAIALALGLWFASGDRARTEAAAVHGAGATGASGGIPSAGALTHSHQHSPDALVEEPGGPQPHQIDAQRLVTISDADELRRLFATAGDAQERCTVVCRSLEVDMPSGVSLALEFLADDPPVLFRMMVVDKMREVTGCAEDYDIDKPFDEPPNRESVAALKKTLGLE